MKHAVRSLKRQLPNLGENICKTVFLRKDRYLEYIRKF